MFSEVLLNRFSLGVLLFGLIYWFQPRGFPVDTRVFLGILGFLVWCLSLLSTVSFRSLYITKHAVFLFVITLFVSVWAAFSLSINGTFETQFLKYPIVFATLFFAAYFFVRAAIRLKVEVSNKSFASLFVTMVFWQSVISFFIFMNPALQELWLSLLEVDPSRENRLLDRSGFRIIGIGHPFFSGAIISGFALILIGYLLRYESLTRRQVYLYIVFFLVILVVGMMVARSTMVGAALAMMLILLPRDLNLRRMSGNKVKASFFILVIPIVGFYFLFTGREHLADSVSKAVSFGFELFINMIEGRGVETASTNSLIKMFVWPDSLATWMIGDGRWNAVSGAGYYMYTDVGYLRLIYYFGVVGLCLFFVYQFFVFLFSFRPFFMVSAVFIYFLVLNIKGDVDITNLCMIFFMSSRYAHMLKEKNCVR